MYIPISVRIIWSQWPEHVAELANEFEVINRLPSVTARIFNQVARLHHMNTRISDGMEDNNTTENSSLGYSSSSYITANPANNHSQPIYPPSINRSSADTYQSYQGYPPPPPPHFFLPVPVQNKYNIYSAESTGEHTIDAKETAHNRRKALQLVFYYYNKHQLFSDGIDDD